jgi:hypothetical protein
MEALMVRGFHEAASAINRSNRAFDAGLMS